jgi:hypothetical protein
MEAGRAIIEQSSHETRAEIFIRLINNDAYVLFVQIILTFISSSYFVLILGAAIYVKPQDSVDVVLACAAVSAVRIFSWSQENNVLLTIIMKIHLVYLYI